MGRSSATVIEAPTAGMEANTRFRATFDQLPFNFMFELVIGDSEIRLHIFVRDHILISPFLLFRLRFFALRFGRLIITIRNFELADPRREDGTVKFIKRNFFQDLVKFVNEEEWYFVDGLGVEDAMDDVADGVVNTKKKVGGELFITFDFAFDVEADILDVLDELFVATAKDGGFAEEHEK